MFLQNFLCLAYGLAGFFHEVLDFDVPADFFQSVAELTNRPKKEDAAKSDKLEGEVVVENILEGVETIHVDERDIVNIGQVEEDQEVEHGHPEVSQGIKAPARAPLLHLQTIVQEEGQKSERQNAPDCCEVFSDVLLALVFARFHEVSVEDRDRASDQEQDTEEVRHSEFGISAEEI